MPAETQQHGRALFGKGQLVKGMNLVCALMGRRNTVAGMAGGFKGTPRLVRALLLGAVLAAPRLARADAVVHASAADFSSGTYTGWGTEVGASGDVRLGYAGAEVLPGFSTTTAMPAATSVHAMAVWNGRLYVSGGNDQSSVIHAPVNADGTVGAWTTSSNPLPRPLNGHGMVAWNGRLYVTGGWQGADVSSAVFHAQINPDGTVGPWTTSANTLPTTLIKHDMAVWNGILYIAGGGAPPNWGGNPTAAVYQARINADGTVGAWTASANPLPAPRIHLRMAAYNGRLYVTGGEGDLVTQSTVYHASLNPDGTVGAWTTSTPPLPSPRLHHSMVAWNKKLYVMAGADGCCGGTVASYRSTVFMAAIDSDGSVGAWTTSAITLPDSIAGGAAAAVNGRVYFAGGTSATTQLPVSTVYVASLNVEGTAGPWTTETNALPTIREYHGMPAWNGRLYVVSGYDALAASSMVYHAPLNPDGTVGAWTTSANPLPTTMAGNPNAILAWNGKLYVVGASGPGVTAPSSSVFHAPINPDGTPGAWTTSSNFLPEGRYRHAATVWNGRLYVTGGNNPTGTQASTVYSAPINVDGSVASWVVETNALPLPLGAHTMAAWNSRVYVAGGNYTGSAGDLPIVYSAPINSNGSVGVWAAETSLPIGLSVHAMSIWNGRIYVAGGGSGATVVSGVHSAPINSSGSVGTWVTETNSFPEGRFAHAMALWNGRLYVSGGGRQDNARTSTVYSMGIPFYSSTGTYFSPIMDLGSTKTLTSLSWTQSASPSGSSLSSYIAAASAPTVPLSNWTQISNGAPLSFPARYVQYRIGMSPGGSVGSPARDQTPVIDSVTLSYSSTPITVPPAPSGTFSIGQNASLVLGQSDFTTRTSGVSATKLTWPRIAFDASGNLWVSDEGNQRILRFPPPFSNGMSADLVLGQEDFTSNAPGLAADKLNTPTNLAFDSFGNLWAVDYGNHRVLRFSPPLSSGMSANLVLGQTDFTTNNFATTGAGLKNPYGLTIDGSGNLWVADKGNNRVLRFSPPFSNGMAAGLALGQAGFTTGAAALSAAGLDSPLDVKIDVSDGLWVADYGNNRALRYTPPFVNGMNADLVLGQADFNSKTAALSQNGLNAPYAVSLDSATRAWVLDRNNNRALRFSPPFSNGMNADLVIGQANFTSSAAATTQNGFRLPLGLALDPSGNLWVAEEGNSRALRFSQAAGAASIETVDAGAAVSEGVRIAVDAQNNLQVAYTEGSGATRKIKHLKRISGAWGTPTVAAAGDFGIGDLAVDGLGNPHICYSGGVNTITYSSFTGTAWTSPQTVDTGGNTTGECKIAVDAFNRARIAYTKGSSCSDYLVYYARFDGASWVIQALSGAGFEGKAPSLALDAAQNPHIAYFDRVCYAQPGLGVRYAKFDGSAWSVQTPGFPHGDGGAWPDLSLDGAGRPRLAHAFFDSSHRQLYYASFDGSSWSNQTVDDPAVSWLLALDGAGNPHLAYSGGSYNLASKYASFDGVSWSSTTIDHDASPAIAIDAGGDVHFAYADGQLRVAHLTGLGLPPPMGGNARGRAQAPGGFQAAAVYQTSVTWSWTDNSSNELGFAIYGSQVSTGPYVLVAGTATIGAGQGSFTETGLSPGTTCYRYVVAVATGGTVASNADSATPNLAASPAPPAAPAGFAGSVLGTSSISWTWSDVSGELGYRVTDISGSSLSGDLPADTTAWGETGRTPNTSYARRVVAFGPGGASPPSSGQSVVTLAAGPNGLLATVVTSHTITLSWSANDNPSGTPYELSFSSDGFLTRFSTPIAFSAGYTAATAGVSGLSASTNYSFRVRAQNSVGVRTDFSSVLLAATGAPVSDTTPPLGSPTAPTDDGAYGNSLVFRWTTGSSVDPESGIAGYHLQVGFSPGASDDLDGDVGNVLVWTKSSPVNGQTYYARVCAKNGVGLCGAYSTSSDGITIDLIRPVAPAIASPTHPEPDTPRPTTASFMQLTGPSDLSGSVGYYYIVDGLTNTTPNDLTGTFSAGPSITTSLLADGTWYFHVVAKDGAGNIGTQAAHYKFIVRTVVDKDQPNDLWAADGTRVEIPAGALTANTAIVISTPPAPPAVANDPSLKSTPVVRDIQLADGTKQLLKEVVVTLPYTTSDVAGLDERSLRLFFHNEASQTWELVSNSVVDTTAKRVTGRVTHFSLFRILGFQAPGGLSLSNYPNPFSPLRGQTTNIRYTLGQDGPARIRIYDSFGSPVLDSSFAAGETGGKAGPNEVAWDGRTGSGRMTEAGTYICVVDAGGQRDKTRIVAK